MAYEVANVSAPAKARSVNKYPLSAPLYKPSRIISAARPGPMVRIVTVEPGCVSFSLSACSKAFRSSGLKIAGSAARLIVPSAFMASFPTLRVSGTCFASTTIFKLIYFNIFGISNIPTANLLKQFERQKDMGRKYAQKGEV